MICLFIVLMTAFATSVTSMFFGRLFGYEAFKGDMWGYKLGFLILLLTLILIIVTIPIMNMIYA